MSRRDRDDTAPGRKEQPMRSLARAWRDTPKLVRFFLCHAAVGFGLAAVFVGGFLLADPHGAGSVLLGAAGHWWPALVLWFFVGLTFGSVQIGAATMLLGERPDRPPRGGGTGVTDLVPVPIPVRARRR
ncbi:hypothetical protein DFH01_05695 [Falsiroseomonas bella]|uniref:Uncharacterized protein n=2 Tax=Falsiroseomonas bella TaxID=2184016 RepID=A0A317FMK2_9PROT|nr:hypothetical protein DFH01_05695 [Falsiroseomonas bella]